MLNVNYSELSNVTSSIRAEASKFYDCLKSIETNNNRLIQSWVGSDASKYSSAVALQSSEMFKLQSAMSDIASFLEMVQNVYAETQEINKSGINL